MTPAKPPFPAMLRHPNPRGKPATKTVFVFRDYGKMVRTLASRQTGEGVRVSLKPGSMAPSETRSELLRKVRAGEADENQLRRFDELHQKRSMDILECGQDDLFDIRTVDADLPPKAVIDKSLPCDRCGERTMASRMVETGSNRLCRDCAGQDEYGLSEPVGRIFVWAAARG